MARVLGRDYVRMVGCTFAVVAIGVVLPQRVAGTPRVVRIGLLIYSWLAVIAVAGGTLFANRTALDRENAWAAHRAHEAPLPELRWLYSRVATWEQPQLADRIAQEMLPLLLGAARDGEALGLVKERLTIDSRFRPQASDARRRLAALAEEWGDAATSEVLRRDVPD
jgi:hypothetical protein